MLQGPQSSSRSRKKLQVNSRQRAQTEVTKPSAYAVSNRAAANKANYNNNNNNKQPQADDLLDLFGFDNNNNNNNNNNNSSDNINDSFDANPFEFNFDDPNNNNPLPNNDSNNNIDYATTESTDSISGPPKTPKKKKTKKQRRAQTIANKNETPNANANNNNKTVTNNNTVNREPSKSVSHANPNAQNKKLKKIDVLPLLHKGVRANKFKLNGNKSKVRVFYLTENNFYFCWEPVGQQEKQKSGLFSKKNTEQIGRKVDPEKSIPIRSIRFVEKNPAYKMQSYNFIPAQHKPFTITVTYAMQGQDKKLNFMAYEAFHHMMFYEGLVQLMDAARNPQRNLNEVFEVYVEFPKEILPKHLRPQKFKWEPLGDNDFNQNDSNKPKEESEDNLSFDVSAIHNVDVYDPSSFGNFGRNRIQSF